MNIYPYRDCSFLFLMLYKLASTNRHIKSNSRAIIIFISDSDVWHQFGSYAFSSLLYHLLYAYFSCQRGFFRTVHIPMNTLQSRTPMPYCARQLVTDDNKCVFRLYCTPQNTAMISVNVTILIVVLNNQFLNITFSHFIN